MYRALQLTEGKNSKLWIDGIKIYLKMMSNTNEKDLPKFMMLFNLLINETLTLGVDPSELMIMKLKIV